MDKKNIIVCEDIEKTYFNGDLSTTVLRKVSLSIKEGEFVAIVGPSGSGKSTLMHILGALDTPTKGKYELDGRDVSKLSEDDLADVRGKKIGFVFQAFNLLPRATVMRNVQLPLIYQNINPQKRKKMALDALEKAGMDKQRYFNRSNQLSGGQMQRVAIARALVNDPALIFADEPTGNLDQKTGKIVLETLKKLNDAGKTIVLITHDLYVAEHADRIIQIRDGEIIEDAKTSSRHMKILEGESK